MNNCIDTFYNEEFGNLRTFEENRKVYFCGFDVASALGYNEPQKAVARHCKGGMKRPILTPGGVQNMTVIPEGDVYRLIVKSKLPAAEKFEKWVFDEVIPSIRKHGAYVADSVLDQLEEHPELVSDFIRRLQEANATARALREQLAGVKAENGRLLPKADYYDSFVSPDDLTCLRYTAKELGVPQNKFIGYLLEHRFVFRDRNRGGRVFALAGKRNDPLFKTRDFYRPNGEKSEYTLVTPAGKAYFKDHVDRILAWEPSDIAPGEILTEDAVFPS